MKYNLHFLNHEADQDSMEICMGNSGPPWFESVDEKIGGTTTANSDGTIASTTGTIPSDAETTLNNDGTQKDTGPALVCFISANDDGSTNYNYGTNPAELTVL